MCFEWDAGRHAGEVHDRSVYELWRVPTPPPSSEAWLAVGIGAGSSVPRIDGLPSRARTDRVVSSDAWMLIVTDASIDEATVLMDGDGEVWPLADDSWASDDATWTPYAPAADLP